jgi:hypothetical protein
MEPRSPFEQLQQLQAAVTHALDAAEALPPDAVLDERLDAAIQVLNAGIAFGQAIARDPTPGDEAAASPALRRNAQRALLALREQLRAGAPDSLDVMIDLVLTAPEHLAPGVTEEHREYCRAVLLDNGFLTESELATFPRESLYGIMRQRLTRWEETGDARG